MSKSTSLNKRVLYEDNHLIAVNKLPSEIIQGDKTGDMPLSELVKSFLKKKYNKPGNVFTGVIHRLDRPVSGAVIFAKTGKGLSRMNDLIKNRKVKKTYWAIVKNKPKEKTAVLKHFLSRNEKQNKSYASDKIQEGSKEAILSYQLIASSRDYHLLEIDLKTGRHHQIRAQLAAIGCPIKGDLKYGYSRSNKTPSIDLHARSISFLHPVKKETINLIANPPADVLWNYFLEAVTKL